MQSISFTVTSDFADDVQRPGDAALEHDFGEGMLDDEAGRGWRSGIAVRVEREAGHQRAIAQHQRALFVVRGGRQVQCRRREITRPSSTSVPFAAICSGIGALAVISGRTPLLAPTTAPGRSGSESAGRLERRRLLHR